MEHNGVIKKYTTLIDMDRLGTKNITAIATVFTDPKTSEEVAQKLAQAPEVLEVYTSLSEELLIIAKITAEDQEQLHTFIANKVAPLPGVMRIRTSIITRKYKEASPSLASQGKRLHL
jgi:DNA-binding Lrp family transcriptional regulator